MRKIRRLLIALCGWIAIQGICNAADWPTYRHDAHRSGITDEALTLPLKQAWVHICLQAPRPAWPLPAVLQPRSGTVPLNPSLTFDRVFQPVIANGKLYFGSSANDTLYCLDARTGETLWHFTTEGPIRTAPTIVDNRLFFGSDDGALYGVDAESGQLFSLHNAVPFATRLPGNERIISLLPVRGGPAALDGVIYYTAGIFPSQGVYLCAIDTRDGRNPLVWKRQLDVSCQGHLLATQSHLYVPTGRTAPAVFDRKTGEPLGKMEGLSGCFALVTDDLLVHGPGETGQMYIDAAGKRERIASTSAKQMIVHGPITYVLQENSLTAIDRDRYLEITKQISAIETVRRDRRTEEQLRQIADLRAEIKKCRKWETACESLSEMIIAGDILFAGGRNQVLAFDTKKGEIMWKAVVDGDACGLAVADGSLFVSTDRGIIYSFRADAKETNVIKVEADTEPYPADHLTPIYEAAAEQILEKTGIRQGYCMVHDCGMGRLAYELAKRSDLKIIGIARHWNELTKARDTLLATGLYGERIAIIDQTSVPPWPIWFTHGFVNLVVSDTDEMLVTGDIGKWCSHYFPYLRPYGGTVCLGQPALLAPGANRLTQSDFDPLIEGLGFSYGGYRLTAETSLDDDGAWLMIRRGAPDGVGEWTHQYADAGNTVCSADPLIASGTPSSGTMEIQWFGEPGPRPMLERHVRAPAPLSKSGRLFIPAADCIMAVDAYNGFPLWKKEIPGFGRIAIHLDCGNMALTEDFLYAAIENRCLALDVRTGEIVRTFEAPQLISGQRFFWGYLAVVGDYLIGSGNSEDSPRLTSRPESQLAYRNADPKASITSRYLFCLNRFDGSEIWRYENGVIWNPCIAADNGAIYFLESRDPNTVSQTESRKIPADLTGNSNCFLVALDRQSGKVRWERNVRLDDCTHVVFLSYADSTILVSGSGHRKDDKYVWYSLYAFSAADGSTLWNTSHRYSREGLTDHGKDTQHPVIFGGKVYMEPYAYDLQTGAKVDGWQFERGGHCCGAVSASAGSLFYRGSNPQKFDIAEQTRHPLTLTTRPGCWINIIPAGGLVLIPESSSGCICPYSIQTSMALAPRERRW
ncbi:MAG TPA: PQQ-binding-like beta-propeller repeat protein [bacterium]|nr:PQQ-binding-like beta-propeller repeat protein [bacterium]